jgi:hypothetical protein
MNTAMSVLAERRRAGAAGRDPESRPGKGNGDEPRVVPSAGFVEAVAELLGTDAADLLDELGYRGPEVEPNTPPSAAAAAGRERGPR